MSNRFKFFIIFLFTFQGCGDNQAPAIISDFNGISGYGEPSGYTCFETTESDSTDWIIREQWNAEILDLFGYAFPDSLPPLSNDVNIKPCPNPTTDVIYLKISTAAINYKFSYRLVDRYYNVIRSGDSIHIPVLPAYQTTDIPIDLTDIQTPDTFRLYYCFFYNNWAQMFHGDIVKN